MYYLQSCIELYIQIYRIFKEANPLFYQGYVPGLFIRFFILHWLTVKDHFDMLIKLSFPILRLLWLNFCSYPLNQSLGNNVVALS